MRLGAHVSVSGGKYKALDRGSQIGCESIQVFVRSVRSWSSGPLQKKEIEYFHKKREDIDEIYPIISHNSYLINLATKEQDKLTNSYNAMLDELVKTEQLGIEYVNMHPGNKNENESDDGALIRIANELNKLMEDTKNSKVIILLETTAGQGNDVGYKFEHMRKIIDNINNKKRIGVTFDTCHSFGAGYDFTTKSKYENMIDEFDDIIGLNYLFAFHFNDSINDLGSFKDRHEHIGSGKIGKEPFSYFINDGRFKNHPGILETPTEGDALKSFKKNLDILKSLRK